MTRAYLGFAPELRVLLKGRMHSLVGKPGFEDVWKAAAGLVPTLEHRFREQLAIEHLVSCYYRAYPSSEPDPREWVEEQEDDGSPPLPHVRAEPVQDRLAVLGVTSGDVKAWAVYQGLVPVIKRGRVGRDLVELYAIAHEDPNLPQAETG